MRMARTCRTRISRFDQSAVMVFPQFFQILCFCLTVIWFNSAIAYKDGLYATEDNDVIPLSSDSFEKLVMINPDGIFWVVEFYNSWCGHCIHFAPTWKLLAHTFQDWADLVKIAAIDCSQAKNLGTCRDFDINRYPLVKIFPPVRTNRKKSAMPLESQELLILRKDILRTMTNFTPSAWPRLTPLETVDDIWKEKKDSHSHVSVIFEEDSSLLGVQVILDMRHTSNLLVRHMAKDKAPAKYDIKKFPSLYKLDSDVGASLLVAGKGMLEDDRKLFVSTLKTLAKRQSHLGKKPALRYDARKDNSVSKSLDFKNKKLLNASAASGYCSKVSMQDLESALHYTFRQEIAICKTIDGEKLEALYDFIKILLKYFPGRPPVVALLKRITDLLGSLPSKWLTGEEWLDKVDQLQDEKHFLPDVIQWDCCRGSQARYRGYPCAMWTLFHTLTVAAYQQNVGQARSSSPLEVPLAIRGYMKHFFGCDECSKNFLAMSRNIDQVVDDHRTAILWLWSAHNHANKRLHLDASEDPEHPKIQFPETEVCPGCHLLGGKGGKSANESWNENVVLKYLLNFYDDRKMMISGSLKNWSHPSFSATPDNRQKVDESKLDWWEGKQKRQDLRLVERLRAKKRENAKLASVRKHDNGEEVRRRNAGESRGRQDTAVLLKEQGWGFTHLDLSMCVVFYIVSTLIILMLYHHFIIRRSVFKTRGICLKV